MKKNIIKLVSVTLCLIMLLSVSGCGKKNNNQQTVVLVEREMLYDESVPDNDPVPSSGFLVGFGRTEILPDESIALRGYGDSKQRMSTGFLDVLYISCIAITDEDGKTALMITMDLTGAEKMHTENTRKYAKETYGIDPECVHLTATHTHSSPSVSETGRAVTNYNGKLYRRTHEAIDLAMADRKAAEIYAGETKTQGMNYDRHYIRTDGTAMSDNYGIYSQAPLASHVDQPDETMRIIKFTRKNSKGKKVKDVVLVSWQAHPHLSGSAQQTDASSDWVGPFVKHMEETQNCYCAYYQGCAGNMNEKSNISSDENNTTKGYRAYGEKLADYALEVYDKLEKYKPGKIKAVTKDFTYNANHEQDSLIQGAREVYELFNKTHSTTMIDSTLRKYGLHSIYQVRAIIRCYGFGPTYTMAVSALSIGDIAFTTAPVEMFCQSGMYIREKSPFKFTVTLSYTDDSCSYLPTSKYYDIGCYEVCITNYAKGGAEACCEQLLTMLKSLK